MIKMVALLALGALAFQNPPDLKLEIEKAIPQNDDYVSQMPQPLTRDLTGCIVADDGSAVFDSNGRIAKMGYHYQLMGGTKLFMRAWEPGSPPLTDPQRGWLVSQSGTIDPKKHQFKEIEAGSVVRVDSENVLTLVHDTNSLASISRVSMNWSAPTDNKWVYHPESGEYPVDAIADLSSDALVGLMSKKEGKDGKLVEHRLLNSKEQGAIKFVPGIAPFRYDSAIDGLLCFTFSESGFPAYLTFQHFRSKERDQLPRPSGSMKVTALLPKGRVIATFTNSIGDDEDDPKYGLYEFTPPYKETRFLGPYRLVGSSRNGKWLLIQHRNLRKSWLVLTK